MKTIILAAALAAGCLSAPAFAQQTTISVGYADLDLSRAADVAKLDRRLQAAVNTACGPTSAADLEGSNAASRCRAQTAQAVSLQRTRALAAASRRGTAVAAASGF